ncbi:MAG: hypothetical protein MK212_10360 [Saprospiraceae bacterium]|nr:hypothetical protein [Saprospiraceae bacterium]
MNLKKILLILPLFLSLITIIKAQFPDNVNSIDVIPNKITEVEGDLATGKIIDDLSWADRSSTACFPGTQFKKFRGNHVLHGFRIPPYSEVIVKVIPDDKNANFSLYGYQVGTTNYSVVPNLSSCTSCEADHKWDYPKRGKTQDHTRSIRFNSIKNSYNIFIGVAGADGLQKGTYRLEIDLKSRVQNTEAQGKLKIYRAPAEKGVTKAYKGDLADGTKIHDLSWAARSSVACFPGTQNNKFTGNHVHYVCEIPPRSKMAITVIPKDKNANMSIYAYMTGTTSSDMVPQLSSCVTCEAEHKWDYPKRGKTQDHTRTVYLNAVNNPYRVVIGVAGADGLNKGEFTIQIKTE